MISGFKKVCCSGRMLWTMKVDLDLIIKCMFINMTLTLACSAVSVFQQFQKHLGDD